MELHHLVAVCGTPCVLLLCGVSIAITGTNDMGTQIDMNIISTTFLDWWRKGSSVSVGKNDLGGGETLTSMSGGAVAAMSREGERVGVVISRDMKSCEVRVSMLRVVSRLVETGLWAESEKGCVVYVLGGGRVCMVRGFFSTKNVATRGHGNNSE
ncbi:hypothetical protein ACFE04_027405 [Oxalis oulophora]